MPVLANTLVPATSLLVGLVSFGLGVADVADAGAVCEAELDHPPKCGDAGVQPSTFSRQLCQRRFRPGKLSS
jgi:hypothetical protein